MSVNVSLYSFKYQKASDFIRFFRNFVCDFFFVKAKRFDQIGPFVPTSQLVLDS